jgi:hypothetical protein
MATFNMNEAIYGYICHSFCSDNILSAEDQNEFNSKFLERHYLSWETMQAIVGRFFSIDTELFYSEIIDSLKNCSYTQKLEALTTIHIILVEVNVLAVVQFMREMNISNEEWKRYLGYL